MAPLPNFRSMEVAGILRFFRRPGKSSTKQQRFDNKVDRRTETAQPLLVLFDHKTLRERERERAKPCHY